MPPTDISHLPITLRILLPVSPQLQAVGRLGRESDLERAEGARELEHVEEKQFDLVGVVGGRVHEAPVGPQVRHLLLGNVQPAGIGEASQWCARGGVPVEA